MQGTGPGYWRVMSTPIYVRSLGQVLGMLSASVAQAALTAVDATRRPRA